MSIRNLFIEPITGPIQPISQSDWNALANGGGSVSYTTTANFTFGGEGEPYAATINFIKTGKSCTCLIDTSSLNNMLNSVGNKDVLIAYITDVPECLPAYGGTPLCNIQINSISGNTLINIVEADFQLYPDVGTEFTINFICRVEYGVGFFSFLNGSTYDLSRLFYGTNSSYARGYIIFTYQTI